MAERALSERLLSTLRAAGLDAVDLSGQTSLGTLAALLSESRLLVCNDTGVSHVAAAVGTRSVVIACGSDTARWAPLDDSRHRVLAHEIACRPCAHVECPVGHPCALAISVDAVSAVVHRQLAHAPADCPSHAL
jgi:ADP-heptose:LPS heptosyltransferase